MRINELLATQQSDPLDEGWKNTLGNIAAASAIGAATIGGGALMKQAYDDYQDRQASHLAAKNSAKKLASKIAVNPITNSKFEKMVLKAAHDAGIRGGELMAFMAQSAHETQNFQKFEESGPSTYFRRYDPAYSPAAAKRLGNSQPGDGELYKGRGCLQLTGRWVYGKATKVFGVPFLSNPSLMAEPKWAIEVSIWFWKTRVRAHVTDFSDVSRVTKIVNGGYNGVEDREAKYKLYLDASRR